MAEQAESWPAERLLGLPVVHVAAATRLGQVHDVMIDPVEHRIVALLLRPGGWLQSSCWLDFSAVAAVGRDAVLVRAPAWISAPRAVSLRALQGRRVLSGSGEDLGSVDDALFDRASGRVTALRLSRGLWDDMVAGKTVLSTVPELAAGGDLLLCHQPRVGQEGGDLA